MTDLHVRPFSRRNGLTLTLLGVAGLVLGLILFLSSAELFAPGLMFFSLGVIGTTLGVAKRLEPQTSLHLGDRGICYRHRRGCVVIDWENVQRIDIPRVHQGLELIDLPFVGIKLKRVPPMLENISPRLATGLLTEQRPLLMTASAQDEDVSTLEAHMIAEFTPLEVDGERFTGVLAMFGHRCQMLDKYLGYHLYLPADCLDRLPGDFVQVMRKYHRQAMLQADA